MTSPEAANIAAIRQYFVGCNSGDVETLLSTLAPDVVHFFLPPSVPTIRGAKHLAHYWRKYHRMLRPVWAIDRIIAAGDEAVSEWSCIWCPAGSERRLMIRGTEWYVMREARIAEIRAYFLLDQSGDAELATFPYAERQYLTME